MVAIAKRSARALVLDGPDLVLLKRIRPHRTPYWTTVGGGVEPTDASVEDTLHREVSEELGGRIEVLQQLLILTDHRADGIALQHIFLARLVAMNPHARHGPEIFQPERGSYEIVHCPCTPEAITRIELMPPALSEFAQRNAARLLALADTTSEAGEGPGMGPTS